MSEGDRVVPVHVLVATGVNAGGHGEILGVQVTSSEDGAGWLAFFRDLTARGLTGVNLVRWSYAMGAASFTVFGSCFKRGLDHKLVPLPAGTAP